MDVTTETFERDVVERSRELPVVVDFWAAWCGPCRTLGPAIEGEVEKRTGKLELVKIDIDARHPDRRDAYQQDAPSAPAQPEVPHRGIVAPTEVERVQTKTYSVPGIHCGHCEAAVTRELEHLSSVQTVEVDLETKLVTVGGDGLDDAALVAAIDEAGYDAEPIPA